MSFSSSCIIRKNTEELRNKLLEMGCEYGGHDSSSRPYLYCYRGVFYETSARRPSRHERIVECEENEELFLAVAGMRDDTDKGQYFVDEEGWSIATFGMYCYAGSLCRSNIDDFMGMLNKCSSARPHHRATLKEIVAYFSDPESYYKGCRELYSKRTVESTMKSASVSLNYTF